MYKYICLLSATMSLNVSWMRIAHTQCWRQLKSAQAILICARIHPNTHIADRTVIGVFCRLLCATNSILNSFFPYIDCTTQPNIFKLYSIRIECLRCVYMCKAPLALISTWSIDQYVRLFVSLTCSFFCFIPY